jgi:hypothetical protein
MQRLSHPQWTTHQSLAHIKLDDLPKRPRRLIYFCTTHSPGAWLGLRNVLSAPECESGSLSGEST